MHISPIGITLLHRQANKEICFTSSPTKIANSARNLPRIKNATYGTLNPAMQQKVQEIHEYLTNIKRLIRSFSSNREAQEQARRTYKALVVNRNPSGFTFDISTPEILAFITISEGLKERERLRFAIMENGEETHYMLDGNDKVVSNLHKNSPNVMPRKFRYMTDSQIEESGVTRYINIAHQELKKFHAHLSKFNYKAFIAAKAAQEAESITKEQSKPIKPKSIKELLKDLNFIFENGAENLASDVEARVSPSSGKVLYASMKNKDGSTVKISKKISTEYKDSLVYISLERTDAFGTKEYINIDLATNNFLMTNLNNGRPLIVKDAVLQFSPEEVSEHKLCEKVEAWTKNLLKTGNEAGTSKVTTLIAKKAPTTPKSNFEDEIVFAAEKEIQKVETSLEIREQKKQQKQKLLSENKENQHKRNSIIRTFANSHNRSAQTNSTNKPQHTPKYAETTQTQVNLLTESAKNMITGFEAEISEKTKNNANPRVNELLQDFGKELQRTLEEKISEFRTKLEELLKQ